MRFIPLFSVVLLLAACDAFETKKAVDPNAIPPLSGREQALIIAADGAAQQGQFDAAERDYLTAMGASQGRVEAHLALAQLYASANQDEKRRAVLKQALELQPHQPKVNYLLGKAALEESDYRTALNYFESGLVAAPDDTDLRSGAGIVNDMLGKHPAAQIHYLRAIRQNQGSDLSAVKTNLAMSYLLANEPKKAIEVLRDEVKKPGTSAVTRHNMALAYGLLGQNTEAKELVHGEMDEETRTLALARLKEYISERDPAKNPLKPAIKQERKTVAPVMMEDVSGSTVVVAPAPKPVAKPVVKPAVKAPVKPAPVPPPAPIKEDDGWGNIPADTTP